MSKYVYTDKMREISGFGGGYEQVCREMVVRGMEWFDAHPEADPKFKGFKDVYGILVDDNDDAKDLSNTITKGTDCTGAMHQACIGHIMYAHINGWDKYVEEMEKEDE